MYGCRFAEVTVTIDWCCEDGAGYDLLLSDTMSWPSAALRAIMHIPTVKLLPKPLLASSISLVAYASQYSVGLFFLSSIF